MSNKLVSLIALSSAMALSAATAGAAENPFEVKPLQGGYQLAEATGKGMEGKCGEGVCGENMHDKKKGEGKAEVKSDKKADASKTAEGKCGEGQCGGHGEKSQKTEKSKHSEGKCGEGQCGGAG